MSNSPLVSYIKISPHKTSPRNHKIDTITIHCVVGQADIEPLGALFQTKECSSNYGIGRDGRIGMYVEEKDCSWCSSNRANDNRAITIECASDTTHPFAINDAVYKSLIDLCVDICKRNDIKELKWKADKSLIGKVDRQNMTVHRWFNKLKSCPGDYIYNRLGQITSEVNARLGSGSSDTTQPTLYRVQVGAFANKDNAIVFLNDVKKAGFESFLVKVGDLYKVQVGAFSKKANATAMAKKLKDAGFKSFTTVDTKTADIVPIAKKSVEAIAREVIQGLWGCGQDRKDRLTKAGYNYETVQKKVNELL